MALSEGDRWRPWWSNSAGLYALEHRQCRSFESAGTTLGRSSRPGPVPLEMSVGIVHEEVRCSQFCRNIDPEFILDRSPEGHCAPRGFRSGVCTVVTVHTKGAAQICWNSQGMMMDKLLHILRHFSAVTVDPRVTSASCFQNAYQITVELCLSEVSALSSFHNYPSVPS